MKLERTDSGILTITMHTNGGSHIHTGKAHRDFAEAFGEIARDRSEELLEWLEAYGVANAWNLAEPLATLKTTLE